MNYLKYKKDSNIDVQVQVFKVVIKANSEIIDEEITNLFNFTLKDNTYDWCNKYMRDNPNCRFVDLEQTFYRRYQTMQNDEHVYLQLKNLKQESTERVEVYYERLFNCVIIYKHLLLRKKLR